VDSQVFRRIVCGSPAVTEIVFALGAGDRVVGVSDFTVSPPEALGKQRIGGLLNPNKERLTALEPDLIVTQGAHEALTSFARARGIRIHSVRLETLDDIEAAVGSLASLLGMPDRGRALVERIRAGLELLRACTASLPRPSVLVVFGRSPGDLSNLTTIGPGTFLDDLLERAGGRNVTHDALGPYPRSPRKPCSRAHPR